MQKRGVPWLVLLLMQQLVPALLAAQTTVVQLKGTRTRSESRPYVKHLAQALCAHVCTWASAVILVLAKLACSNLMLLRCVLHAHWHSLNEQTMTPALGKRDTCHLSPVLTWLLFAPHLQEAMSITVWKAQDVLLTMHQVEPILCARPHGA